MSMLARWAGYLAIAGGAIATVVLIVAALGDDPDTPVWDVFFLAVALLGLAVLGLYQQTRSAVGQLGKASAWLSALGALGLLLVGAYAIATNQYTAGATGNDPLLPLWLVTTLAWFLGALGFGVALIRGRALSSIGAWLVLVGAVAGVVAGFAGGENPPPALFLIFVVFGVGWMVLGYSATRRAAG